MKNYLSQGSLLDVGAGIGEFLHIAQKHFQVRGTEVSESAIAVAKEKYGISLEKGELEHIDFRGATFDVITLFHVLEHVPSPLETIKKCKGLLNKNGLLIIAVPNDLHSLEARIRSLLSFLRLGRWKNRGVFGLPKITLDGTMDEIHLSHFTVPVLKRLLNTCGFEIVDDSLDPFYLVKPKRKFIDDSRYALFLLLKKLFGKNWYPTIWMAATLKKT